MKYIRKWTTALLLLSLLISNIVTVNAASDPKTDYKSNNNFIINGKSISRTTSSANFAGGCHRYEHDIYKEIWGINFSSQHSNSDNMLKNLSAQDRKVTVDHLKQYIGRAPLGSAIRIAPTSKKYEDNNYKGHSMILVEKNETGFTTLEGGLSANGGERRAVRTYTWAGFVNNWNKYCYINYIIWPHSIINESSTESNNMTSLTITFDPNGGSVSPTTQTIQKGGDPRNLPTPVREGYVFCGWVLEKIDADFTGTFSTASVTESSAYGFEEDTTIYALWQREKVQHIHEKINPIISPEHPHYIFYTCSCGEVFTDGTTTSQPDTCGTCFLAEFGNEIEGIIPEPPRKPTTYWTDWGPWSNTPVYPSDTREVETRQVKVSDGRTEYRYGGYVTYDGKHDCWCETYLRNKFGSATLRYSDWSTTRYSPNGKGWSCGFCGGNHIGVDRVGSDGRCWWAEYVLPDDSYYWEESRTTEATYETQYRYRDLISD